MTAFRSFAAALVVVAAIATVSIFTFAKPEPPGYGKSSALKVPESPAASPGWTWKDGTPGWFPDEMSADLRMVDGNVWTTDLAGARAAARREGLDPASVRVLRASRYEQRGGLVAIVAAANRSGRTCLGFVTPRAPVAFTCPRHEVAFVVVTTSPPATTKPSWPTLKVGHLFPVFFDGVVSGDVTRVVVRAPNTAGGEVFERSKYFWGTFTDTPGDGYLEGRVPARNPWRARLDFYGVHGRLASLVVRLNAPGYRVFTVR